MYRILRTDHGFQRFHLTIAFLHLFYCTPLPPCGHVWQCRVIVRSIGVFGRVPVILYIIASVFKPWWRCFLSGAVMDENSLLQIGSWQSGLWLRKLHQNIVHQVFTMGILHFFFFPVPKDWIIHSIILFSFTFPPVFLSFFSLPTTIGSFEGP